MSSVLFVLVDRSHPPAHPQTRSMQTSTHILRARDLSVSGSASFGVLIAIVMAAFILLCIFGNSSYRRMRQAQQQYLINLEVPLEFYPGLQMELERPLLWECYVPDNGCAEISHMEEEKSGFLQEVVSAS